MATVHADEMRVWSVRDFIDEHDLEHLRPRQRGDPVVLESGPRGDATPHARARRVTSQRWSLELPDGSGRWGVVPLIRAPLREALDTTRRELAWNLTPRESSGTD